MYSTIVSAAEGDGGWREGGRVCHRTQQQSRECLTNLWTTSAMTTHGHKGPTNLLHHYICVLSRVPTQMRCQGISTTGVLLPPPLRVGAAGLCGDRRLRLRRCHACTRFFGYRHNCDAKPPQYPERHCCRHSALAQEWSAATVAGGGTCSTQGQTHGSTPSTFLRWCKEVL